MGRPRKQHVGKSARRGQATSLWLAFNGVIHWFVWHARDLAHRLVVGTEQRARRGHRALKMRRAWPKRPIGVAIVAVVLGVAMGVLLGRNEHAPPAKPVNVASGASEPIQAKTAAKPVQPVTAAKPAAPPVLASVPTPAPVEPVEPTADPVIANLPVPHHLRVDRKEVALASPPPLPPPAPELPRAQEAPKAIASHDDPHIVYEEAVPEPGPATSPRAEHKPVLLSSLSNFTVAPSVGPKPLWLQNALAIPDIRGRPMVAIVIDDVGIDRKRAERAMHLPGPVTLSFMTYAPEVALQAKAARADGHEIMMHVPMEPENPLIDPGPNVLRARDGTAEVLRRLDWDLRQFSGYVAINNHMGSKFTQNSVEMLPVLRAIKSRGLFFLDSRTTGASVGGRLARQIGLPYLERDVFLDNVDEPAAVSARLAEVERVARHYGYAIAIGHPRDVTLDALARWTAEAGRRGIALVPISTIMRFRLATEPDWPKLEQVGG